MDVQSTVHDKVIADEEKSITEDLDLLTIEKCLNEGSININNNNNGTDEGKVVVRNEDESVDECNGIIEAASKKNDKNVDECNTNVLKTVKTMEDVVVTPKDKDDDNNINNNNRNNKTGNDESDDTNDKALRASLFRWHVRNLETSAGAGMDDLGLRWNEDEPYGYEGRHALLRHGFGNLCRCLAMGGSSSSSGGSSSNANGGGFRVVYGTEVKEVRIVPLPSSFVDDGNENSHGQIVNSAAGDGRNNNGYCIGKDQADKELRSQLLSNDSSAYSGNNIVHTKVEGVEHKLVSNSSASASANDIITTKAMDTEGDGNNGEKGDDSINNHQLLKSLSKRSDDPSSQIKFDNDNHSNSASYQDKNNESVISSGKSKYEVNNHSNKNELEGVNHHYDHEEKDDIVHCLISPNLSTGNIPLQNKVENPDTHQSSRFESSGVIEDVTSSNHLSGSNGSSNDSDDGSIYNDSQSQSSGSNNYSVSMYSGSEYQSESSEDESDFSYDDISKGAPQQSSSRSRNGRSPSRLNIGTTPTITPRLRKLKSHDNNNNNGGGGALLEDVTTDPIPSKQLSSRPKVIVSTTTGVIYKADAVVCTLPLGKIESVNSVI